MTAKLQSAKKTAEIIRRCKRYSKHSDMRKPYSLNNLSYRHGIANSTVNKLAKGWESSSLSGEIVAQIRAEHKEGLRLGRLMDADQPKVIAADLDISHNTVRNIYAKYVRDNKPVKQPKPIAFHRIYTKPISSSPGPAQPYY